MGGACEAIKTVRFFPEPHLSKRNQQKILSILESIGSWVENWVLISDKIISLPVDLFKSHVCDVRPYLGQI